MKFSKTKRRKKIHHSIRRKISGTSIKPRLSVFRSNRYIYCQLVDDISGHTIVSASTQDQSVDGSVTKSEQAKQVGKLIAEKAQKLNIDSVLFDRSGYLYHGRVKALAEGAREGGLKF